MLGWAWEERGWSGFLLGRVAGDVNIKEGVIGYETRCLYDRYRIWSGGWKRRNEMKYHEG